MAGKSDILCFLLVVAVALQSCKGNSGKTATPTDAVKDYPVMTITPRTTTLNSEFPATIEGQQDIEIRPKIDGYMEQIYVDEGANVERGQRLFRISAPQYEQEVRTAEAAIKIAKADVNSAQMEVNRVRPLVEKGIISKYELQSAQYNLQAKQAALAQATATLANARTNLGYTLINSPVEGVIGTIPYKIGSLVSSNTQQPLTTVSNTGNIYAYFSINEKDALDFSRTAKGTTTRQQLESIPPVTLILANGTEYSRKGKIEATSGTIDTETGSIRVRATFPNPSSIIRSGSSGIIRIPRTVDSAILVPQKSTFEIQGKTFVYRLDQSGKVTSTEIKVMENSGGQFFVVREGLQPGQKVVLEGVATLREGATIKPREANVDSIYRSVSL